MEAYRRLSRATTLADLEAVIQSMTEAYGPPPPAAQALLDLTELRIAASTLGIDSMKLDDRDLIFEVRKAAGLQDVFADAPGRLTVIDEKTLYYRPPEQYLDPPSTLLAVLRKLLVRPVRARQAVEA
jgi:transcription-repair coupling factor (superfamily II helicase)